ncbi:MAG TPA: hypothetical protein ENI19_03285 [Candidatus Nealsonbacteria bacterium]|uniref:Uncharacterized protein n=1 Tax=marine sediment metagenome TaxID=412755 RepID=A0A0F9YE23_9ZZZZ|nr:hypothetical protein [Candidatus Nealsonbacteria bacterium]HEB46703.1 hypothetical protein [Candidatus Nealsonbacteria bacterium]
MLNYFKKTTIFLLAVFILTAVFFSGSAQASFWDMIRAWVTINPLEVDISAPEEAEINKVFKVEAKLINKGEEKIENARGEIFLPSGLTLLKKSPIQKIGIISGKKEKRGSWSVKGEELGYYLISVKASGEIEGKELSKESITIKVKIKEKAAPGERPRFNFFQNIFNFFQKWLDS